MLVWDSSYSVRVKEIDDQHKYLIKYINQLYTAMGANDPKESIALILNGLALYTVEHFSTEEKYFKKFNYEHAEEHIQEHQKLIQSVKGYVIQFEEEKDFNTDQFLSFLRDWLIDHIMDSDKEYMHCFAENGLV